MKTTYKIIASLSILGLASCVSQQSTDPIGDGFTNASNAIGSVVNKVVPPAPLNPQPNTPPPSVR